MIESREFVLAAVAVMLTSLVVATTMMTLAPMKLQASTQEDEDDDDRDESPALTLTKESTNPSGRDVKEIQSDEHSSNAEVKITRSSDHNVDKEDRNDDPAHTGEIVFKEDGEVFKKITQESAPQSSKAASTSADGASKTILLGEN